MNYRISVNPCLKLAFILVVGLQFSLSTVAQNQTSAVPKVTLKAGESKTSPPDPAKSYYYFLRAQDQIQQRNFTKAEEEFQHAMQYDPASAELRFQYAQFLLHWQNLEAAHKQLEICLELDPGMKNAHKLLARLYGTALGNAPTGDPQFKDYLEKVLHQYEEVLRLDPEDTDSLYELGKLHLSIQNLEKAEFYLKEYIDKTGSSLEGLYYLTLTYFQSQKYEEALKTIQTLESQRPNWYQIKLLKADILTKLKRGEEAETIYKAMLAASPSDPAPYLNYAGLLLQSSLTDKAMKILESAQENSAVSGELLDLLGQIYRGKYMYDKAISAYKDAIALDPSVWDFRYHLGVTYARMGDSGNGIAIFKSLIQDTGDKDHPLSMTDRRNRRIFLMNLGFLFMDARQLNNAITTFDALRKEYPDDKEPVIYIQLAEIFRNRDQNQRALAVVKDGLQKMPDNIRLLVEQALIQVTMGQDEQIIVEFKKKMSNESSPDVAFYQGLATLYSELEQWDKALIAVDTGLEKFADSIPLLFQRASILEKSKRYQEAKKDLLDILNRDPENANAWNYLGYMLIDFDIDVENGITYINKALTREPKNPAFLDSLGWGFYKQQKYEKAIHFLLQAAKGLPDDPVIFEHLGDVYAALGRSHEARDSYEKSLSTQEDPNRQEEIRKKIQELKPKLLKKTI